MSDKNIPRAFLVIVKMYIEQYYRFCHVTVKGFDSDENYFYMRCLISTHIYMDILKPRLLKLYESDNAPKESEYDELRHNCVSTLNPLFEKEIRDLVEGQWMSMILR